MTSDPHKLKDAAVAQMNEKCKGETDSISDASSVEVSVSPVSDNVVGVGNNGTTTGTTLQAQHAPQIEGKHAHFSGLQRNFADATSEVAILLPAPAVVHGVRRDIDGLRAVAVMLVLIFHTEWQWLSGGFIGVDVFFVLSGYLITCNLLKEAEQHHSISIATFYSRRFKRLLPASLLVLALVSIVGAIVLPTEAVHVLGGDVFAAVLYFSNQHFLARSTNYFDPESASSPLIHFWSLSIEEQFYFVWPLLLCVLVSLSKQTTTHSWRTRAHVLLFVCFIASVMHNLWLTPKDASHAYFELWDRAWELLAGAALAFHHNQLDPAAPLRSDTSPVPPLPLQASLLTWAAFLGLLGFSYMYDMHTVFPGTAAIGPVVCTIIVLHTGFVYSPPPSMCHNRISSSVMQLLSSRATVYVGNLSYLVYLLHWPCFIFTMIFCGAATLADVPWYWLVCATAVTFVTSAVLHTLVENPCRRRKTRAFPTIAISLLLTLAFALVAYFGMGAYRDKTAIDAFDPSADDVAGLSTLFQPYKDRLGPFKGAILNGTYSPEKPSLVLLGDSHGRVLGGAFADAVEMVSRDAQFFMWAHSACPPFWPSGSGAQQPECRKLLKLLPTAFRTLKYVDAVVLAHSIINTNKYLSEWNAEKMYAETLTYIHWLADYTNTVIFMVDPPALPNFRSQSCNTASNNTEMGRISRSRLRFDVQGLSVLQTAAAEVQKTHPQLKILTIDVTEPALCDSMNCNWMEIRNGTVVCRVSDVYGHLSMAWARTFAPRLATALTPILTRNAVVQ